MYIVSIEEKKHGLSCHCVCFAWAPPDAMRMRYASSNVYKKLIIGRGCLSLLCSFPGGHLIRANIQCGHCKVVKSLHFILAQSRNSIIAIACPLKSSCKEHN